MFRNVLKVLRNPNSFIVWFFVTLITLSVWYVYSDVEYVAANYQSHFFAYFDIFLSWCMIILFPLMIAGILYRSLYFGMRGVTEKKSGFIGIFSGIVSGFIAGASCCGPSLISLFGLTSVITFLEVLPYHGTEIKTLGIALLIYSFYDLYKNLEVCKVRKSRK